MKIVICGDSHIGAIYGLGGRNNSGGNTRVDDYEKTLNYIADYCIENKIDIFVQTGDAFDHRNPTSEQLEIFNSVLKKLSRNGVFSVVIMGNHDYKKSGNSFTSSLTALSAQDQPNVRVVLNPEMITVSNSEGIANLLLMPYRDRRLYGGKTNKIDSESYGKEVEALKAEVIDGPIVAVGHNFYYEGSYNDYGGAEVLASLNYFKGCDFVAMGHHHDFKILRKTDPIAIYTGSMERLNFGDSDSKKVFIEYNTETKKTKVMKAPIRELWDHAIDLSESTFETIEEDIKKSLTGFDLTGKIVRLKITLQEKLGASLKKTQFEKMLYDMGAFYVSKVNFEQIYQKIVRDTSILEEKGNFNMFAAFVKNQEFDSDMELQILQEAKNIIG